MSELTLVPELCHMSLYSLQWHDVGWILLHHSDRAAQLAEFGGCNVV